MLPGLSTVSDSHWKEGGRVQVSVLAVACKFINSKEPAWFMTDQRRGSNAGWA